MKPSILETIREHAFVASVSIAAFTHSSWSLATVFGGQEPSFGWAWAGWIIPAALIAASIDIGLLSLATHIQNPRERTAGRILSFGLLALGMFALQGLYVSSHMPVIPLAAGVRVEWAEYAALFRDSMLIVVPGLLPLALVLHTISGSRQHEQTTIKPKTRPMIIFSKKRIEHWTLPKGVQVSDLIVDEFPLVLPPSPNGHNKEIVPTADGA